MVASDGALFYWRLGESAGTTAIDAKGTLDGVYSGGFVLAQPGALGASGDTSTAVGFGTAGAGVTVPSDPRHLSLASWTVEAWLYPTSGVAASDDTAILTHQFSSSLPLLMAYGTMGGGGSTRRLWGGFYGTSGWWRIVDPTDLPLNAWAHVVVSHDGATTRVYRNGIEVVNSAGYGAAVGWAATPATPLLIGKRWDSASSFPGRIDEVALYPTALSATQVLAHYTAGSTAPPTPSQTVPVTGVYPPLSTPTICGVAGPQTVVDQFTVDDGHLVSQDGPLCGVETSTCGYTLYTIQFVTGVENVGTAPAIVGRWTNNQFGGPTAKVVTRVAVGSVLSAQLFGTVQFRVSAPTGGVPSAQQFGVPTVKATISWTVGAVSSAQSFGAPAAKATFNRTVTGLGTAQSFGTPVPSVSGGGAQTRPVIGLASAQSFGTPTTKATVTRTVGGVASAGLFGAPTTRLTRPVGGVPSAQAFGVPRTRVTAPVGSVGSAQQFGVPLGTTVQRVSVPGVRGSSAYTDSIVDQFRVDDGHTVNAESSASYFGTPWVGHLWLLEADCIDFLEPAICGAICGIAICGGTNFIEDTFCYGDSAIVNTFLCGQMLTGELGASFLSSTTALTIVDQFVVDDGHVVDGALDGCLVSPLPAICDPGTICGTVVCGGASYISKIDCLLSPDATIVNEFICGQRYVGGRPYNPPITVTRTIDLTPAGCL